MCVSAGPLLAMRPAAVRTTCKAATHVLLARMLDAIVDSARICIYNANCQHSGEKKMRHFLLMVRKFTRDTSVTRLWGLIIRKNGSLVPETLVTQVSKFTYVLGVAIWLYYDDSGMY